MQLDVYVRARMRRMIKKKQLPWKRCVRTRVCGVSQTRFYRGCKASIGQLTGAVGRIPRKPCLGVVPLFFLHPTRKWAESFLMNETHPACKAGAGTVGTLRLHHAQLRLVWRSEQSHVKAAWRHRQRCEGPSSSSGSSPSWLFTSTSAWKTKEGRLLHWAAMRCSRRKENSKYILIDR